MHTSTAAWPQATAACQGRGVAEREGAAARALTRELGRRPTASGGVVRHRGWAGLRRGSNLAACLADVQVRARRARWAERQRKQRRQRGGPPPAPVPAPRLGQHLPTSMALASAGCLLFVPFARLLRDLPSGRLAGPPGPPPGAGTPPSRVRLANFSLVLLTIILKTPPAREILLSSTRPSL